MEIYTKELTSLQHPLVKYLVKLRKERGFRLEEKKLLLQGKKAILEYPEQIDTLLITKKMPLSLPLSPKRSYWVSQEMIKKISGSPSPEPYLATVPLPSFSPLNGKTRLLALDRISDPGNLGTLIRTALALGCDGIFLTTPSADPFMDKALRAAKGATFHLPLCMGTEEELLSLIKHNNAFVYIADRKGTSTFSFSLPFVLILGNESHGVSKPLQSQGSSIAIPISNATNSLNVAVAGGILMYAFQRALD